jgi:thymidylate synthase (FAD)
VQSIAGDEVRLIKPLVIVEDDLGMVMPNGVTLATHMAKKIETFTRKCYKSEGKMTEDSHSKFLPAVFMTRRHTGIAEHRMISVTFITDRGVSHEGVRHRMAAYLQESTRYCDYSGKGVTYILPPWVVPHAVSDGVFFSEASKHWSEWYDFVEDLKADDERYARWRKNGWRPEMARYWLPQGVKTEYAASLNIGSWHNFLVKRTAPEAHPQIRQLAIPLLRYFQKHLPEFFADIHMPPVQIDELGETSKFAHKEEWYDEAKLHVNPFYEQVPVDVVYES